jgi:CheY-like chemotaxis protein
VLVAAPADVVQEIGHALGSDVKILGAETWDQALARLDPYPSLILVCYAFDGMRPFGLIRYVREEHDSNLPIILVRALPVPLGKANESQIRDSYQTLGVDEFINFYDTRQADGTNVAYERLRTSVFRHLPRQDPAAR